tara:strand:- start:5518 stop:5745 length:228 start_codon:yes stop_codon:yes gene_type:complete
MTDEKYNELVAMAKDIANILRGVQCRDEITNEISGHAHFLPSREYDFVEREVFNNLSVPMMHPEEYENMMMYGYD